MSEGEDFEGCIASTAKEDSDGHKERENNFDHELLLARRNVASPSRAVKSQVADFKPSSAFVYRQVVFYEITLLRTIRFLLAEDFVESEAKLNYHADPRNRGGH